MARHDAADRGGFGGRVNLGRLRVDYQTPSQLRQSRLAASGRPHPLAVVVIKAVHTAIFLVELSSIVWLVISGLLGRRDRSVAVASAFVAIEAAVFVANDGICPLTPLTERLGATRGSVSDIFLPTAVARTIPIWSSALLVIGVLLHTRAALRSRGYADG